MSRPVKRRHVFFLSGFDPKGASYYHALYAAQAQMQGRVTGAAYTVSPRIKCSDGNSCWSVDSVSPQGSSHTTYEFVRWDDIVRSRWPRTGWGVLAGSLRAYISAIGAGRSLIKVWRVAPKTLFSLCYPALVWLAAALMSIAVGVALAFAIDATIGRRNYWGAGIGMATAAAAWIGALRWERRLHTTWLLRIYQFAADWASGRIEELPQRLDQLFDRIAFQLGQDDLDEVLLIGFSVGSMLAVSAAARVKETVPAGRLAKLSVLTLGHCIPLLGLMPRATKFRADLARMGGNPALNWLDFSSTTDWGSFALVDPVALCLRATAGSMHGPALASPRFHTLFKPATYAQIRGDKRRMHLQYLMAAELPGPYDFFAVTAGPLRLADRFNPAPTS